MNSTLDSLSTHSSMTLSSRGMPCSCRTTAWVAATPRVEQARRGQRRVAVAASVPVNIDAGRLPVPHAKRKTYLVAPLRLGSRPDPRGTAYRFEQGKESCVAS